MLQKILTVNRWKVVGLDTAAALISETIKDAEEEMQNDDEIPCHEMNNGIHDRMTCHSQSRMYHQRLH